VIGVIDTGVDTAHPALAGSRVETITTRRSDREPSGKEHGTGVVSLLVGEATDEFGGAAPGARVVAVDAFHRGPRSDTADTHDLIAALDELADRGVRLINLSFSGVDNPFLREAIEQLSRSGVTLVAAVGAPRDGDATGFPARYPGVIAVASVDSKMRTGRSSIRGSHVAFAAPGNGIVVATGRKGYGTVEGSSFAAPFVTAALAMALQGVSDTDQAVRLMASGAMDLGAPGRDPVFGWGLIQFSAVPPC
jgi:subtilisin family serine protease